MVPELLEVSELKETNLSLRSFMSGSPGLRAPWKRHFFMELKTSGSSISSESSRSFESSDSTCSTSIVTKELVPKNTKRAEKFFIHNSQIIYTYQYHNVSSNHILLLAEAHVNQFHAPLHIVPPLWSWNPLVSQVFQ